MNDSSRHQLEKAEGAGQLMQKKAGNRRFPLRLLSISLVPQNYNFLPKFKHSFLMEGANGELPVVNRRLTKGHLARKKKSLQDS